MSFPFLANFIVLTLNETWIHIEYAWHCQFLKPIYLYQILSRLKEEEIMHFEYTILEIFSAAVFLPMTWALHRRQTCRCLHYFNDPAMHIPSPFPQFACGTADTDYGPADTEISWEVETSRHCIRNTLTQTWSSIQYICCSINWQFNFLLLLLLSSPGPNPGPNRLQVE